MDKLIEQIAARGNALLQEAVKARYKLADLSRQYDIKVRVACRKPAKPALSDWAVSANQ